MIRLYCGEYMKVPVGLHMMLNECSHNCYYCFAKLSNLKGTDFNAIYKQLQKLGDGEPGKNLAKYLFQKGHSICISNTTDPFAASNADGFKELSEWMTDRNINFMLQTRGGKHFSEVIRKIKPTAIYFTVTSDRDDFVKLREPAAPLFEDRMQMIKEAKEAGHFIIVGLNPYVSAWWQDFNGFAQRLLDMGVDHIWLGAMHMTAMQLQAMHTSKKTMFASEIKDAMAKKSNKKANLRSCIRYLDDLGFNATIGRESTKLNFWDDYFKLGYPFMPTSDGFLSHLHSLNNGEPLRFSLDYFHDWANVFGDMQSSTFHEYLKPFRRSLYNDGVSENIHTSRELHEIYWRIMEYPTPLQLNDLSYALTEEDCMEVDEKDNPILVYTKDHGDAWFLVDEEMMFVGSKGKEVRICLSMKGAQPLSSWVVTRRVSQQ